MGRFPRLGGVRGRLVGRRRAVVAAAGAVVVLGGVAVGALTGGRSLDGTTAGGASPGRSALSGPALSDSVLSSPALSGPARVGARTAVTASAGGQAASDAAAASGFRQIILPDLLVVAPAGMTASQVARLRAIAGVRDLITFDGAEITAGGVRVGVLGVNPSTFRPWVPLQTASNRTFWSDLARGDFVAAAGGTVPHFISGGSYRLVGGSAQVVQFGLAAPLDLAGVDVLVNQALSARLGLVRQVAGLISAPGVGIGTLRAKVALILGASVRTEVLRSRPPVASVPLGTRPTSYLQLFKASAARYCPGLSWTVLAAIGQIESGDGQNVGPSVAGALGPMQFLPSTWQRWGIAAFGQTGPPDVMNPYDAVPSAARLLCADGAAGGGAALASAVYGYNHAAWYVREVLALAAQYAADYS